MAENNFTIIREDGEEVIAEILFTHQSEEFDKNYVVFQITGSDEVSAAVYQPDNETEEGMLADIETDEEWDMLDQLLEKFYDELEDLEEDFEEDDEDEK